MKKIILLLPLSLFILGCGSASNSVTVTDTQADESSEVEDSSAANETTNPKTSTLNYKIVARRGGDIEQVWADTTFANEELGWKAELGIESMMSSASRSLEFQITAPIS